MDKLIFLPRNVVITFNNDLTHQFIEWSHIISTVIPSKIVLNERDALPHMTLYTTNYPEKNTELITKKLAHIAKNEFAFSLQFNKKTSVLGTIFIEATSNQALQQLHETIVDSLNPLREGFFDEKERELPGFTKEMELSLTRYGMWAAKKLFTPHVSVARPTDPSYCNQALGLLPDTVNFVTRVESISLVERGPNGTCKNILETFQLK